MVWILGTKSMGIALLALLHCLCTDMQDVNTKWLTA